MAVHHASDYAEKIERFLRTAVLAERPAGPCARFQLAQMSPGGELRPILPDWPLTEDLEDLDLSGLADEMAAGGQEDANGFPGSVSRYTVLAYFGTEKSVGASSSPFHVRAENDFPDMEHFGSEPANEAGLVAKLMRHNEILFRGAMQTMSQATAHSEMTIKRLSEQNSRYQEQETERIRLMEELHSGAHQRRMEEAEAERSAARKTKLLDQAMPLLPILANSLMGKKVLSEPNTETAMVKSLVDSIDSDQMAVLMQVLKPTQLAVLKRFQEIATEEQETH